MEATLVAYRKGRNAIFYASDGINANYQTARLENPQVCADVVPTAGEPQMENYTFWTSLDLGSSKWIYLSDTEEKDFADSKEACQLVGGTMPMIRNQEELEIAKVKIHVTIGCRGCVYACVLFRLSRDS